MQYKVFVSGGTGSVGSAIVRRFSTRGDEVTFQYYNNSREAAALSTSVGAKSVKLDFGRPFVPPDGAFDIVINNAGINVSDARTHEVADGDWEDSLRVNLHAPFVLVREYLPNMVRNRWGRIINIGSIYSLRGVEGNLPYTVSKHALSGLTKTVAREYGKYAITCNEICPGPIDSDLMQRVAVRSVGGTDSSVDDYLSEVTSEIPAGRMAKPEEVAALAVFLGSPEAAYVNGASLVLDGGLIA